MYFALIFDKENYVFEYSRKKNIYHKSISSNIKILIIFSYQEI